MQNQLAGLVGGQRRSGIPGFAPWLRETGLRGHPDPPTPFQLSIVELSGSGAPFLFPRGSVRIVHHEVGHPMSQSVVGVQ